MTPLALAIALTLVNLFILYCLSEWYHWRLEMDTLDTELLRRENELQAERIDRLEQERARLHLQLLSHLSEPGQQINAYRN